MGKTYANGGYVSGMILGTNVPLDGCVVHVVTQKRSDDGYTSRRWLSEGWVFLSSCEGFSPASLTLFHKWACDPQSCARAVLKYRQRSVL